MYTFYDQCICMTFPVFRDEIFHVLKYYFNTFSIIYYITTFYVPLWSVPRPLVGWEPLL